MAEQPLLSIVITSYTPERLNDIYELLDSIKAQTYPNIETIFLAERSRELYDQVKAYGEKEAVPNMKVVFNRHEAGLSAARNLGIKHASGDIIGFVDDDVVLFPDWVEKMVKTYDNDSIIGVTGPAFPIWEDESIEWLPKEFYWIISCTAWFDCNKLKEVRNAWGMNMSFRREAFDVCQFFDTFGRTEGAHEAGKRGPVGDDSEFSINLRRKTGKAIVCNPDVKVWHKVYQYRLTPRFIQRQAYWQGYTKAMFKKLYSSGNGKDGDVLAVEHKLLQRILLRLFPSIVTGFFPHPVVAWRKLSLTVMVLFHLTLGYLAGVFPWLANLTAKAYR